MELLILCPQWGHEHLSPEVFLSRVKEAGFDGVDTWMPEEKEERKKFIQLLKQYKLAIVSHQHQAKGDDIKTFCKSFEYYLNVSLECEPLSINSHSGRDYFTMDEQLQVLDTAFNFSVKNNIQINHETHRGRLFFSPGNAEVLFNARPEVSITADLSHWVCVSENLNLTGFEKTVDKAIQCAAHIHGRVGFEEGPQITDPRLPAWKNELSYF
jgi:sugar phosphate isomerase/epimerase